MSFSTKEMTRDEALALAQWFGDGINKYFDKEFDMNRAEGEDPKRGFYFVFYNLCVDEINMIENWINRHCTHSNY